PESAIDRILDAVSSALKVEADPLAADIMTVALGEATRGSAGLRGRAMLRLTDAMGRRLQTLRKEASIDPAWSRTLLRSLDVARQAMLEQGGAGAIDKEFAKRAAVFSGQVFVFANDWVAKGMRSEETELSRAVAAAEGLAVIAHGAASGQRVPEKGLQRIFDSSVAAGKAGEFTAAIQSWVGADGLLLKSPYSAPASEFAPAK
ncbi:MAG: hypothetical protein JNK58_09500, partial [Phycisphaerae bacterium]|nr:hypothetical protein [Phycisphaerae bacterium]